MVAAARTKVRWIFLASFGIVNDLIYQPRILNRTIKKGKQVKKTNLK